MSHNPIYSSAFFKGLKPDPMLSVSGWADAKRILPTSSSAEPGRWRTSRTPYLREIMDELSPQSPTEQVKVIKGTQLGFTEVANNLILCYMDTYPCPIQMIMPTERLAGKHSKTKLSPSISMIPALNKKVKSAKSKDDAGGMFEKEFDGGMLSIGWSNAAASFASFSARVVILDDVDRFPDDVEGEGNPVALGKNRADAFSNRKIYVNSSPTIAGGSMIEREYEDSDQREYEMPCPHCGGMIVFDWNEDDNNFIFEYDHETYQLTSDVKYKCEHCSELIDEYQKTAMMDEDNGAKWEPRNPGHHHRGYKLPSFYSPVGWLSWISIVRDYLGAKKAEEDGEKRLMKRFVNTRLAQAYKEKREITDKNSLLNLKNSLDEGIVPPKTAALVMAVDVQKDHFWFEVKSLTYGNGTHLVRYGRAETWADVELIIRTPYYDTAGGGHMIRMCAVDSGYLADEVYEFCAMNSDVCIPVKGASQRMITPYTVGNVDKDVNGRPIATGLKLYKLDTEYYKDILDAKIKRSIEAVATGETAKSSLLSFHNNVNDGYVKQYTSEYKHTETNSKTGVEKSEWRKVTEKADNHLWDCGTYITFLGELLGIRFLPSEPIETVSRQQRRERPTPRHDDDESNY